MIGESPRSQRVKSTRFLNKNSKLKKKLNPRNRVFLFLNCTKKQLFCERDIFIWKIKQFFIAKNEHRKKIFS